VKFERIHDDNEGDFLLCPLKCRLVFQLGRARVRSFKCRGGKLAKESGCVCCPDYQVCVDADQDEPSGETGLSSGPLALQKRFTHQPATPVHILGRTDARGEDLPCPEVIC